MAEDDPAQGPEEEADGVGGEGVQHTGDRSRLGKEQRPEDQCRRGGEDVEIVELDRGSDEGGHPSPQRTPMAERLPVTRLAAGWLPAWCSGAHHIPPCEEGVVAAPRVTAPGHHRFRACWWLRAYRSEERRVGKEGGGGV